MGVRALERASQGLVLVAGLCVVLVTSMVEGMEPALIFWAAAGLLPGIGRTRRLRGVDSMLLLEAAILAYALFAHSLTVAAVAGAYEAGVAAGRLVRMYREEGPKSLQRA